MLDQVSCVLFSSQVSENVKGWRLCSLFESSNPTKFFLMSNLRLPSCLVWPLSLVYIFCY